MVRAFVEGAGFVRWYRVTLPKGCLASVTLHTFVLPEVMGSELVLRGL